MACWLGGALTLDASPATYPAAVLAITHAHLPLSADLPGVHK